MTRREFLRAGTASAGALALWAAAGEAWRRAALGAVPASRLDALASSVVFGGPPKDGIPPIERPKYISVAEADKFLRADDVVFGLHYRGTVKAFPQIVLVWHEIVNEEIAGTKLSITYCPLTGSAVAYAGRSKIDGKPLTFGTSGKLVNSNLLMYDRQTDSTWPQILGIAITGRSKGQQLSAVPLTWTTWERWKRKHSDTLVLSRDTGHLRAYGRDPYGSYTQEGSNYYNSGGPFFPVMAKSDRFPDKKVVIGIKAGDEILALPKAEAAAAAVTHFSLGGRPLVAFYDDALDEIFAFDRRLEGREMRFGRRDGQIVDEQTRTVWSAQGRAAAGKLAGAQLPWATSFDVLWFSWYAFYPDTKVLVPQR